VSAWFAACDGILRMGPGRLHMTPEVKDGTLAPGARVWSEVMR
jgi:hypothetical protein